MTPHGVISWNTGTGIQQDSHSPFSWAKYPVVIGSVNELYMEGVDSYKLLCINTPRSQEFTKTRGKFTADPPVQWTWPQNSRVQQSCCAHYTAKPRCPAGTLLKRNPLRMRCPGGQCQPRWPIFWKENSRGCARMPPRMHKNTKETDRGCPKSPKKRPRMHFPAFEKYKVIEKDPDPRMCKKRHCMGGRGFLLTSAFSWNPGPATRVVQRMEGVLSWNLRPATSFA